MIKRNRWNKLLANVPPSRNTHKDQANRATAESVGQVRKYLAIKEFQSAFEEEQHARGEACEVHNMSERRCNLLTSEFGEMRDTLEVSVRAKKAAGEVCQPC